jgi:hypothetical protein
MHNNYIFDFDYTLYKTSETVLVWSPRGDCNYNGKTCLRLLPSIFAMYKLADDEIVNDESFVNFYNIDFEKAIPIKPTLEIFHLVDKKIVLSARPPEASVDFYNFVDKSTEFIGLKNSTAEAKLNFINKFDNPIVFEDSGFIINSLRKNNIDCVHVIHDDSSTINLKYYLN